jgi:hypothetical protein
MIRRSMSASFRVGEFDLDVAAYALRRTGERIKLEKIPMEVSADGICQRAAGLPPWGSPAANFVTFPLPAPGPLVTLQTSEGGSGDVHIDFVAPTISDGTQFDVMFRLVNSLTVPRTNCEAAASPVTVK